MTDTTAAPAESRKSFEGENIWLPLIGARSFKAGALVLDGYAFRNCTIEGPAVLAVVDNVQFKACDFGDTVAVEDLFLRPMGARVTGAVGFANTVFENCRFVLTGFTGGADFLANAPAAITTSTPSGGQA